MRGGTRLAGKPKSLVQLAQEAGAGDQRESSRPRPFYENAGRREAAGPDEVAAAVEANKKLTPAQRCCGKCGGQLRINNSTGYHKACEPADFKGAKGHPLSTVEPEQLLRKYLGPFLRKAKEMEGRADKIGQRISVLHRQEMALRDAANRLRSLAESTEGVQVNAHIESPGLAAARRAMDKL